MNRKALPLILATSLISFGVCAESLPSIPPLPDISPSTINSIYQETKNTDITNIDALSKSIDSLVFQGAEGTTPPINEADYAGKKGESTASTERRSSWNVLDETTYVLKADANLSRLLSCMEYRVVGSCLSVRFRWGKPRFTHRLAVEHFVRDVHVEVVPQAPSESWLSGSSSILPSANDAAQDAVMLYPITWRVSQDLGDEAIINTSNLNVTKKLREASGQTIRTQNNRYLYSDVQVSGNIERQLFDEIAKSTIGVFGYCDLPTVPGMVYYNSTLDQFSWRWMATSETVLTSLWMDKYREWNDIGRSYGSTFPRTGYQMSHNRFHTSVVSAIRGTSIAAENREQFSGAAGLHIYQSLPQYARDSFTGGQYQTPQDAKSFKLSMIYPTEGPSCTRYGSNDNMITSTSFSAQREEDRLLKEFTSGNARNVAAFKLYRPFRCCGRRGSRVWEVINPNLGSIGTPR
ncbi:TraU family protein [Vibrio metschnikovii]|nr:TraU family protein [Vibrio metschnikovii]